MRFLISFSFIAFFLSGFSSLVYELTWVRFLKHIFGSDSLALSTLLTVFIGGIALGTFLTGKLIKKYFPIKSDLSQEFLRAIKTGQSYTLILLYALVEFLVAVYAIFVPFIFGPNFLGFIWSQFSVFTLDHPISGLVLKFLISAIFLLMPTMLIGAGFPILSEILVLNKNRDSEYQDEDLIDSNDQLTISNLYATNTMGAILGALLTGFLFLPVLGLNTSVYLASSLNLLVVILVALVFFLNKENLQGAKAFEVFNFVLSFSKEMELNLNRELNKELRLTKEYKKYKYIITILIWIGFFLGFVNLALEVVWTKILSLVIGSSTYSITLILIAVLLGISLGAYFLNYFIKLLHKAKIHYYDFLKASLLVFALAITVSSSLFNSLPWLLLKMNSALDAFDFVNDLWLLQNFLKFSLAALIAFPVTFVEGLVFAFILYLISSKTSLISEDYQDPVGTRIARASAMNTFGAIIGSFFAGFVFLPLFGKFGDASYLTLISIIIIAFLTVLIPYLLDAKEKWQILALLLLAAISISYIPKLNPQELSSGANIYKNSRFKSVSKKDYKDSIDQEILFHKDGLNATITVEKNTFVNAIFLKNNGKIEAGVPINIKDPSKTDMMTQILLGKIPVLIKPDAKSALLVGMGSGVSLKALADSHEVSDLKEIDVCELEALIYEAADKFFVKKYPSEVKINRHISDARIFIQAARKKYDVIISQPSDPWISGPLFTREFWQSAADKLEADGLFVQWLQLYSIDPEYLTVAFRTFQQVFPEVLVFKSGSAAELILVGSKNSIEINSKNLNELIAHESYQPDLAYIGINDAADLLSNLILTPNDLNDLVHSNLKSTSEFNKNPSIRITKYISDLAKEKILKPKLSFENLKNQKYKESVDQYKGRTSTDDNMLLEFHTSKNLDNFYKTIKANERLLSEYASAESLIEFLVEDSEPGFLLDLALAHNNQVRDSEIYRITSSVDSELYIENIYPESLHGSLAIDIAESLHEVNRSPKGYFVLNQIYTRQNEPEKAEAIIYDSKNYFSDLISFRKKNTFSKPSLVVFEGLVKSRIDSEELAALASLYNHDKDTKVSEALMEKAFDDYEDKGLNNMKLLAELNYLRAKIYMERIKNLNDADNLKKYFVKAFDSLNRAIELDKYNSKYYLEMAKFDLIKVKYYENEKQKLLQAAKLNLERSIEIFPNSADAHYNLAKIYIEKLPEKQLEIMTILNSPVSRRTDLENLDKAIKYLRNALSLEPLSIKANYEMANLQYKIGNLDLAFRHVKRLKNLCIAEMLCLNELGEEKLERAKELYKKMNNLIVR